jgi:hypothetical protein
MADANHLHALYGPIGGRVRRSCSGLLIQKVRQVCRLNLPGDGFPNLAQFRDVVYRVEPRHILRADVL